MANDLSKPITEQQFTNSVLAWAKALGWRCFHVRTSGRMQGRNAIPTVQGDKGFPDLVLVRPPRLIFAELKVGRGKASPQQLEWLTDLSCVSSMTVECYVWRPSDWSRLIVILSRGKVQDATAV